MSTSHSLSGRNTLYEASPVVVDPPGGRARAAAVAELQDVIKAQLDAADADGVLRFGGPVVDVLIATDAPVLHRAVQNAATQRWRASITRCDVFVDCRHQPGVAMSGVAQPARWGTWWAMDGSDTRDALAALAR